MKTCPPSCARALTRRCGWCTPGTWGTTPRTWKLWTYAAEHALVIVTKDADFTDRILVLDAPPPWLVALHCGNLRARPMREFLEGQWPRVEALLVQYRLIQVYLDRIEVLT